MVKASSRSGRPFRIEPAEADPTANLAQLKWISVVGPEEQAGARFWQLEAIGLEKRAMSIVGARRQHRFADTRQAASLMSNT